MKFRLFVLVFVALGALLSTPAPGALGASYVVDTTADDPGITLTACAGAAGDCSLRGAITNANAAGTPGDVITFDPGVFPSGTPAPITLSTILPLMSGGGDTIDGTGAGVIIDAAGETPTFTCLSVTSAGNTIKGLRFTDCTAALALANAASDGNTVGPGNLFYDNITAINMINDLATGNTVIGNMIGTNAAGSAVHPDGGNAFGISISGTDHTVGSVTPFERNIISGNNVAILISGPTAVANRVIGNFIGTSSSGTADLGNNIGLNLEGSESNVIGGLLPGEGNLISGNTSSNITIQNGATANTVLGNIIGPDITGSGAAMTSGAGVYIVNGVTNNVIGPRNIISDNGVGVRIDGPGATGNVVKGNRIGTSLNGTLAVPNGSQGVFIQAAATSNIIGGTNPGDGNVIAFNADRGVAVLGPNTTGNTIRGNSIHSNAGLAIDNFGFANLELSPPILVSSDGVSLTGFACASCEVDVFSDISTDAAIYEGSVTAAPDGSFTFDKGSPLVGPNLTATNTDATGNTSELSLQMAIDSDGDGTSDATDTDDDNDGIPDAGDPCRVAREDFDGFDDADGCPDPDNDSDGICDPGMSSVSCSGSDSGQTCFDPAGTLPCAVIDCRNMAEDYDAFKDSDGCPEPDNDNDGFPDGGDTCPGAGSQAGPDGMLGSPQDLNHNGIQDGAESPLTSDDITLTFEDNDGVLDGDGCHDSPGEDFDGDGFTDDAEALTIGTSAGYPCGFNSWPADLWDQPPFSANKITIQDMTAFIAPVRRLGTSPGDPNFNDRWDLVPGKGIFSATINIQDMTAIVTLAPPMLNGARALNGPACPYPSQ